MVLLRLCLAALLLLPGTGQAQTSETETQIKAAFLYKFGAFVEWPPATFAAPDSPLAIGVLGADALAGELERVAAGRTVHGRPIQVRRLRRGEPLAGLHILFVGAAETAPIDRILQGAKGQPLLVVTEARQGPPPGSMINFVAVDDRVRFDVALAPAEQGRLKISSRLLAVARRVIEG